MPLCAAPSSSTAALRLPAWHACAPSRAAALAAAVLQDAHLVPRLPQGRWQGDGRCVKRCWALLGAWRQAPGRPLSPQPAVHHAPHQISCSCNPLQYIFIVRDPMEAGPSFYHFLKGAPTAASPLPAMTLPPPPQLMLQPGPLQPRAAPGLTPAPAPVHLSSRLGLQGGRHFAGGFHSGWARGLVVAAGSAAHTCCRWRADSAWQGAVGQGGSAHAACRRSTARDHGVLLSVLPTHCAPRAAGFFLVRGAPENPMQNAGIMHNMLSWWQHRCGGRRRASRACA